MIESADEFRRLRLSENPDEQRRASHDSASAELWFEVVDRFPELAFWVAQNKTVPVEVLARLAEHPDPRVRSMVGSKRKIPESLQLKLAQDPELGVRQRIAYNASATGPVLRLLAADSEPSIREHAGSRLHPGTPGPNGA